MKEFLKEYWLWIVVPIVLVLGALALVFFLSADDGASPFQYNVF